MNTRLPVTLFTCIKALCKYLYEQKVCMNFQGKTEQTKVHALLNHREIGICKND